MAILSCVSLSQPDCLYSQLYGLYKHITVSPAPTTSRPPLFDLTGRAKWDAWKATSETYGDRYADAESRYLDIARQMGWTGNAGEPSGSQRPSRGGEDTEPPDGSEGGSGGLWGMGYAVSTVAVPRTEDESSTIHTMALSNNADDITSLLKGDPTLDVNERDEFVCFFLVTGRDHAHVLHSQGYTPLHLASDRGSAAVVELLLRVGADPDLKARIIISSLAFERRQRFSNDRIPTILLRSNWQVSLATKT